MSVGIGRKTFIRGKTDENPQNVYFGTETEQLLLKSLRGLTEIAETSFATVFQGRSEGEEGE